MPFGLKNAAQAFQRLMDGILRHISFAFVYIDDILVASPGPQEHKQHLHELFRLLESNGIDINRKKCSFGQSEVRYLGHLVNCDGIRPLPLRVEDFRNLTAPDTRLSVQKFLGMVNYYRRFIPGMASILAPLNALQQEPPGRKLLSGLHSVRPPSRKPRTSFCPPSCSITPIHFRQPH